MKRFLGDNDARSMGPLLTRLIKAGVMAHSAPKKALLFAALAGRLRAGRSTSATLTQPSAKGATALPGWTMSSQSTPN